MLLLPCLEEPQVSLDWVLLTAHSTFGNLVDMLNGSDHQTGCYCLSLCLVVCQLVSWKNQVIVICFCTLACLKGHFAGWCSGHNSCLSAHHGVTAGIQPSHQASLYVAIYINDEAKLAECMFATADTSLPFIAQIFLLYMLR